MIVAKCVDRLKDKKGNIYNYVLEDKNKNQTLMLSSDLKKAIALNKIKVTNLTLTKDCRLILKEEKNIVKNPNKKVVLQEVKMPPKPTKVKFYVSECMEYKGMGKNYTNIPTLEQAINIYKKANFRPNMGSGIGISYDDYEFDIKFGHSIDVDTLEYYPFKDDEDVHKAIAGLIKAFPQDEVFGTIPDKVQAILNDTKKVESTLTQDEIVEKLKKAAMKTNSLYKIEKKETNTGLPMKTIHIQNNLLHVNYFITVSPKNAVINNMYNEDDDVNIVTFDYINEKLKGPMGIKHL